MDQAVSVTHWIEQFKEGDSAGAQALWDRYFSRLVTLARRKLESVPRRVADEEDVALSAFNSFCVGVSQGRILQLNDRHDLWKVLVTITARKAAAQRRYSNRQKRGGGHVRGESVFDSPDMSDAAPGIAQVIGTEPTPAFAAQVADECRRLLETLGDEKLETIVQWKLEGYSNIEIAERLGVAPRTVERKLERIRHQWERVL